MGLELLMDIAACDVVGVSTAQRFARGHYRTDRALATRKAQRSGHSIQRHGAEWRAQSWHKQRSGDGGEAISHVRPS